MNKYYQEHRKEILKRAKRHYYKNRNKYILWHKKWRKAYKDHIKKYRKEYYWKNRKRNLDYNKMYYIKNKKKRLEKNKQWRTKNKNYYNNYMANRRRKDIYYRLLDNLRSRLYLILKGKRKYQTTKKLVGCSLKILRLHLEKKFKKKMNWNNYGRGKNKWVIDHIIPCIKFDLRKKSEQRKCFNYKNLQPLWWKDNLSKGKL
jgi:hypothetical protein